MWNCNNLKSQIADLIAQYPKLTITEANSKQICLCGDIEIFRTAEGFTLKNAYNVEIIIPLNDTDLPIIRDVGNAVDFSYPHRYSDGGLCLETDTTIRMHFIENFILTSWMIEYVEPYFFSYEFYTRFGYFPFGERKHGIDGMLQAYQDLFNEPDISITCKLMLYASSQKYRGHVFCPCGSGKRVRKCHGIALYSFMTDQRKITVLKSDLALIRRELEYEQSRRNMHQTE